MISAQYPLPDYAVDFLRLARDFNAGIVVFLGPLKDIDSVRQKYSFRKIYYIFLGKRN